MSRDGVQYVCDRVLLGLGCLVCVMCVCVQAVIRSAGGIGAIVTCMGAHPGSVDVADNACYALGRVASNNAENQVVVADVMICFYLVILYNRCLL